jgi:hypothetical protein
VVLCQKALLAYTQKGSGEHQQVLWEPFGGTMSMGLACLTLGRKYFTCEENVDCFNSAELRMRRYVQGRLRSGSRNSEPIPLNTGDLTPEAASVVTLLACRDLHNISVTMFPPNCDPATTKTGALDNHGGDLYIQQVPKEEFKAKGSRRVGQGVYTNVALVAGEPFANPMYAFGTMQPDTERASRATTGHPIKLKAACLQGLVLLPAPNCLMRYINDCRGTGKKANVALFEADVGDLSVDEGYKLLEVLPIAKCAPKDQLLINFNHTFFTFNHKEDEGTPMDGDSEEKRKDRRTTRNHNARRTGRKVEPDTASEEEEADETQSDAPDPEEDDTPEEGEIQSGSGHPRSCTYTHTPVSLCLHKFRP